VSVSDVARRYARALFVLVKQKGVQAQALADLQAVAGIMSREPSIREYFENPLISPDQKMQVIKSSFSDKGMLEETLNLMLLLAEKNRLSQLAAVSDGLQQQIDEENGITRGTVRAARPLSADALKDLETKISGSLKKKIVLTFKEDPRLLGGAIAEVGGWTFDDSIETHLRKMNEDLNRSAR